MDFDAHFAAQLQALKGTETTASSPTWNAAAAPSRRPAATATAAWPT
jgi:hypothetical protein